LLNFIISYFIRVIISILNNIPLIIDTIFKYTLPVITAILGFLSAFFIEQYRNNKKIREDNKIKEIKKRRLYWNAFLESWENHVDIIAMIKALEEIGDEYRKRYLPSELYDIKFKELENFNGFKEEDFYFIYKVSMLKKKVTIINNTLKISWNDINFHKLDILINYLKTEQVIFFNYVLKFIEYLKVDIEEFKFI